MLKRVDVGCLLTIYINIWKSAPTEIMQVFGLLRLRLCLFPLQCIFRWRTISSRLAVRVDVTVAKRKSQSEPFDAHHASHQSPTHCQAHDIGIRQTAKALVNGVPSDAEPAVKQLSSRPMRFGGFGLRSAERAHQLLFFLGVVSGRNPGDWSAHTRGCSAGGAEPDTKGASSLQAVSTLLNR